MKDPEADSDGVITLDDVCEFIVDCLHKTAPTQSTGYPSIRTPNVGRGRLILQGVNRVSEEVYEEWTKRAAPEPGDLILAREAPAGNVAVIKDGQTVCLGQRTVHLRPDRERVDSDFLCYYLLAPRQQGLLLAGETGATAGHVNMRDIRRLDIGPLPSLDRQKTLGQTLSAYDDLIENNRRRIALLEAAARVLYREWFVYFRFPGHEYVKIVDGIPEGWARRTLVELAEVVMGQSPKSQFYNEAGDGLPFHQGVTDYGFRFVSHRTYSTALTKLAEAGNILVSVRAPVGRINITRDKIVLGRGLASVRSRTDHQSFLFYALKNHFYAEDIIGTGAIYTATNKKELERQTLIEPHRIVLAEFEEQARDIDQNMANLTTQNEKLAQARDLLLPRLMNGEITV